MRSCRADDGFSLMEMLVALVLLAAVLGFASVLVIKSMEISARAGRLESALAGATRALERIGKDVRASEGARLQGEKLVLRGASYSFRDGGLFRGSDLVCRDLSKVGFRLKMGGELVECVGELAAAPGKPLYGAWCARGRE